MCVWVCGCVCSCNLRLQAIGELVDNHSSFNDLCQLAAKHQRARTLCAWHDHATILGRGFIMITIHVIFDKAVFLTSTEYKEATGEEVNVQAEVEQPEVYLLAMGTSSIEDQASLISDRIDCLQDLSLPLAASSGIQIVDTLRFFTGDKPASQFERGTQMGGTYKCGGCGVKNFMMDDQAHTLGC